MFPHTLGRNVKVVINNAGATAAATTTLDGSAIDMTGFEGVMFVGTIATTATDNGIEACVSTDTATANMEDVLNSRLQAASSTALVLDVYQPPFKGTAAKKYVWGRYVRTTSTKAGAMVAILYGNRRGPIDNGTATSQAYKFLASPATGASTST